MAKAEDPLARRVAQHAHRADEGDRAADRHRHEARSHVGQPRQGQAEAAQRPPPARPARIAAGLHERGDAEQGEDERPRLQEAAEGKELEEPIRDDEGEDNCEQPGQSIGEHGRRRQINAGHEGEQHEDVEGLERDAWIGNDEAQAGKQERDQGRQRGDRPVVGHLLAEVVARRHQPLPVVAPTIDRHAAHHEGHGRRDDKQCEDLWQGRGQARSDGASQ